MLPKVWGPHDFDFFLKMNTFVKQELMKLMKSESKVIYNVTKEL